VHAAYYVGQFLEGNKLCERFENPLEHPHRIIDEKAF